MFYWFLKRKSSCLTLIIKNKNAVQDFYFVELGEREKNKKYALMHFTKNKKETNNELVNFCFD